MIQLVAATQSLSVMEYHAPLVTIREGNGWLTYGHFNLVHLVNLSSFELALHDLTSLATDEGDQAGKQLIDLYAQRISESILMLRGVPRGKKYKRSIDWLGSAWKWIAGSPDKIDWDHVLQSEEAIVEQNNNQFRVNEKIFGTIHEMVLSLNNATSLINNAIRNSSADRINQAILNKLIVVKDEVGEVVRACQMAKRGIVNTNLLDAEEVHTLISELEVLPYANVVQAVEYGRPMVFTNGFMLLYVLSMPKVRKNYYHVIIPRAAIHNGKQLHLRYGKMLINQAETWGVIDQCLQINNFTVCEEDAVEEIPENSCLPKAIKGGEANCSYVTNKEVVIELVNENTIFISNFRGTLEGDSYQHYIEGTYVVQFSNETVKIDGKMYSSRTATSLQALPPALTNITMKKMKLSLDLVHDIGQDNIRQLQFLRRGFTATTGINSAVVVGVLVAIAIVWRKLTKGANIPRVDIPIIASTIRTTGPNDPRDADI